MLAAVPPPFAEDTPVLRAAYEWAARLHATQLRDQVAAAGPDAHAVYAADKIAKARELRAQAARTESLLDDPALQRRLEHYERSLAMLCEVGGLPSLIEALAFELWALHHLPPA